MSIWPLRQRRRAGGLTIASPTAASYLAARAALRCSTASDEVSLDLLPDESLLAFVDAVTDASPQVYRDPETLRQVAQITYETWLDIVQEANERAQRRAHAACEAMNFFPPDKVQAFYTPLPEEMPASFGAEWSSVRSVPLWEVLLMSIVGAAHAERKRSLDAFSGEGALN